MSAINTFLLQNNLRIATNPCVSPDFCLDWPALLGKLNSGAEIITYTKSRFSTDLGEFTLIEDKETGDCAWQLESKNLGALAGALLDGFSKPGGPAFFPATFANLLRLKNLIQEHNPKSTIFPSATEQLGRSTLGIGARFTTLHWPAVEWAMAQLGIGVTANQNSIPRELVYDTDVMLAGKLDTVPFPV
ncbi:MAG: hypothetical protein CFE26_27275, partial [Verrucomicrobiales bacterium VVV1]